MNQTLILAWRIALRELRGSRRGLAIFLACLTLGVAAISGVGSLRTALTTGLESQGQAILGGDVEVRLNHRRATADEMAWLESSGDLTVMVDLRSMASGETGRMLVQLNAVDGVYPLYGTAQTSAGSDIPSLLARQDGRWGALAEPAILDRLGLAIGDEITIGAVRYILRGQIEDAPDRLAIGLTFGPRMLIAEQSLAETDLIRPGSLVRYYYRLALPLNVRPGEWAAEARERFPDAGWRIRDRRDGVPGVRRFVSRLAMFLTLAGLTALIVGGVGVGNGVRDYLDGKTATIATLKCLGAPARLIYWTYLIQVLMFAGLAIVLGLIIGGLAPFLVKAVLGASLPIPVALAVYPRPLALAALYGGLVSLLFALWPIVRARDVPGSRLFRALAAPIRRWPRLRDLVAMAALVLALLSAMIWGSDDRYLAAWFMAGVVVSFAGLRATAMGVKWLARKASGKTNGDSSRSALPSILRMALANLHRPGAAMPAVVLSLGLGITLLAAINLINGNLSLQIMNRIPAAAPAFFFIDILPEQAAAFERDLRALDGVSRVERTPMLRGRITHLKNVSVEEIDAATGSHWILHGDRGLTYADSPPDGTRIVAGRWWKPGYDGPPLVSFDAEGAAEMGLALGDQITLNVLGREIVATISSLRAINWGSMGLNFTMVFSPNTLDAAPHMQLATVYARPEAMGAIDRMTADAYPGVSAVRVREAIDRAAQMMGQIAAAIQAIGSVTIAAGLLVLAGAMASGQQARIYDSVVLKILGATRWRIIAIHATEYLMLGLITAVIASALGVASAWAVLELLMGLSFTFLPGVLISTVLITVVLTLTLGLVGTARSLRHKPMRVLNS